MTQGVLFIPVTGNKFLVTGNKFLVTRNILSLTEKKSYVKDIILILSFSYGMGIFHDVTCNVPPISVKGMIFHFDSSQEISFL